MVGQTGTKNKQIRDCSGCDSEIDGNKNGKAYSGLREKI